MYNKNQKQQRLGEEKLNKQGCLMKIIEYNNAIDITVEFQDEYKIQVHTTYYNFKKGGVKNPFSPSVCGVGILGNRYPATINNKKTKEYNSWQNMLTRCFDEKEKQKYPTYKNATCYEKWLLFDNFYEWLHSQPNFDKWLNEDGWALDKDILIKGNKMYSPETCCLVPHNVNVLFTKHDAARGNLPIGVIKHKEKFEAQCMNPIKDKHGYIGVYNTPEEAFQAYKMAKENVIKQVAQDEYDKGNITRPCYEAMMNYEVEITD